MKTLHFTLILHSHQPLGNFDNVVEDAYRKAYLPFIDMLFGHPKISLNLHYSGSLLEWIEKHHPEYFEKLREMVARDQVELLGGGYYEPILISIPDRDKVAQLNKLSDYLEKHFNRRPRGIWLTERVWEPALPKALAEAGIHYTLTDDTHFLNAGLEPESLFGDYITDSYGAPLRVIPGQKELRYLLPFQNVDKTVEYLRDVAEKHPGALVAMGDDLEKFGVWPETFKHVYLDGWLEDFFTALEEQGTWLRTVRASEYLDLVPPIGRIYLPTASYQEMMQWALPEAAERVFDSALHKAQSLEGGADMLRFLRGGLWNNFFHKYSEANQLHKRMLWASRSFSDADLSGDLASEAYNSLLAGQCNDAYWHGVFGGLYAPHLRHALYANLVKASRHSTAPAMVLADFDVDGRDELVYDSESLFAVLDPGDGATIPEIDYKPGAVNVVNSLRRRHENYHDKLRLYAAADGADAHDAKSIHDRVRVKEPGLEKALIYDRYDHSCFRAICFDRGKSLEAFAKLELHEDQKLAGAPWTLDGLVCTRDGIRKTFSMRDSQIRCDVSGAVESPVRLGLELVFNLMAPEAHDRYFDAEHMRQPLRWQGEIAQSGRLTLYDWYLGIAIHITAEPAATWWVAPIHTVSQSEDGFERVYQGSKILPWWNVEGPFEGAVTVEIASVTASSGSSPG